MFYELRQYRTRPGQRENWVRFMEEVIIPFQTKQGMTISGSFIGQPAGGAGSGRRGANGTEDDDLYVWIRRFESEGDRDHLYAAVYESDHWKEQIAPKI